MPNHESEIAPALRRFEKASLLLQVHALQSAGAVAPRNDRLPLDALLVDAGLTQAETAWLLGKSQQAVSAAIQRASTRASTGGS
jgi:hypothetical protein